MSERDNGGPAYPQPECADYKTRVRDGQSISIMCGMSLRDYFAGQALIAIIGLQSDARINGDCSDAYMYADQMLEARGE